MKKHLAIAAAALMLLWLTACGPSDTNVSGSVAPPASSAQTHSSAATSASSAVQKADDVLGSTQSGVYSNAYWGIGCELNEYWTVASQQELLEILGMAAEMTTDEDLAEMLQESGYMYDLYTYAEEGLVTLSITIEDLGLLYGTALDEEDYVQAAVTQLAPALESSGYTNVQVEATTHTFAGASHCGTIIQSEFEGVPCYERQVCLKAGHYIMTVTAVSFYEDITADLLAMFYAL